MTNSTKDPKQCENSGNSPIEFETKATAETGKALQEDSLATTRPAVSRKIGNTNALRHGSYHHGLLAWESKKDFDEMLEELKADLKPRGKTQEETVLSIAQWIWKRQRVLQMSQIRSGSVTLDDVIRSQSEQPSKYQETDRRELANQSTDIGQTSATSASSFDRAYRPQEIETEIKLLSMIDREIDKCLKRYIYLKTFQNLEAAKEPRQIEAAPTGTAPSIIAGEYTEVPEGTEANGSLVKGAQASLK
jgi:hypothetical protein